MHPSQYQPGQVLPGTVYRVVRHLATGGMGSVYDVEDVTVEKRYVLKTLHPNLVAREDLALRMRDEARSLARLQHPNIVDVVTAGVTSDAQKMPFYVMERLIGQNLRVVLEKTSSLHFLHAYRIAIDLADALDHAHENNIVHRDVKPENIFLHRNSNGTTTTKLLDFGIVRLLDRKASHTQGKFIGTLRYASPEQITGKKVGPPTDIYSLGAVLFEMLSGRGPFDDAGDAYAIGAAHASEEAPPLSRFAQVSPDIERLVASALAKDPQDRPRDCFAFASEVRRILRDAEASPRSATAVNILSAGPPEVPARHADTATSATGPTQHGMIPPSDVAAASAPAAPDPPPTRPDRGAPVSPIAPTLAAAGSATYSHDVADAARGPREIRGGPTPIPAAGSPPPGRPIDRSAPTRASSPFGETQRLAQNDTRIEDGIAADDVVRDAFGESVSLVVPPVGGGSNSNDIVFPPMQGASGTGPISGEAQTRPPERGAFILVGVAAVFAVMMVGGAFLAVQKPWKTRVSGATTEQPSNGLPTASALADGTSSPAVPTPTAPTATVEPTVTAAAPATPAVVQRPAIGSTQPAAPTASAVTKARPSPPHAPRAAGDAKPRAASSSMAPAVPFDP